MKGGSALRVCLVLAIYSTKLVSASVTVVGCGTTKTCFRNPDGCDLSDSTCRFFSWAPDATGATYNFEMSGDTGGSTKYIAMALAKESQMADADLYYCDGTAVRTGVIQTRHTPPSYSTTTGGFVSLSAELADGVAQCSFARPASVIKNVSNNEEYDFNITQNRYYLLGAIGPMSGAQIMKHDTWKTKTSSSMDFSALPDVYAGCGSTKTCFSFPDACQIGTQGCYFYSWWKSNDTTYDFEIVGSAGAGSNYAAIALGTQSTMVDADTYYCDGQTVRSAVITVKGQPPANVDTAGLSTLSAKTLDGVAHCLFRRPSSVVRTISNGVEKTFDLNAEKYFLLAASGPMAPDGNTIMVHSWKTKTENRIIGSSTGKLNSFQPVTLGLLAFVMAKLSRDL